MRERLRTETKIRTLKTERKSVMENGGKSAAKRSSVLAQRIERVRAAGYIWRCFGDAIAFEFLDKYALKQCFYHADRPTAKQRAGFLSDKEGLSVEIAALESFLEQKVPALLVDLTDTIRHGDVCVLEGPDPQLLEVKARGGLDARGRRQRDNLQKLQAFFENDEAEGLRGFPTVTRRTQFTSTDQTYIAEINASIAAAREKGYATVSPEPGLHYVATTELGGNIDETLKLPVMKKPWIVPLNEFKAQHAWAPYYPFMLSIEGEDELWAFVRGDVYLVVAFDMELFHQIVKDVGYVCELDLANEDHPLIIKDTKSNELGRISSWFLRRIALEFVSPKWLVQSVIELARSEWSER